MGQYGNQPDFATKVAILDGSEYPYKELNSAAIYIGALTDPNLTTTSIEVMPVGNDDYVTFTGITAGSFLPVIVTAIKNAVNIPRESILLIY